MNKKLLSLSVLFLALNAFLSAATLDRKPDFLIEDDSGKVIKRGIYTTGAKGEVLRYDIVSEDTRAVLHSEIPVYDNSGEIVLTRVFDGTGALKLMIVFTESGPVKLGPDGKILDQKEAEKIYRSEYQK